MRKYFYKLLLMILAVMSCLLTQTAAASTTLTLGVFAYRPKEIIAEQYQPLVDYLNTQLHQERVKLQVLDLDEIEKALADKQLDFVFTNPRHYSMLRHQNNLTGAIATLVKLTSEGHSTQNLGGVIFTRSSAYNINKIADIRGYRIATPGIKYLGGYQAQAYELLQAGIELPDDAALIETGSHGKVIEAVLSGTADVGFVRTEILEKMSHNGKFKMAEIKVLNRQNHAHFPFISSTRLYPEWPFIALSHVDFRVTSRMASALLAIDKQQSAIRNAGIAGFAPPADYLSIEEVAIALRLPPHDKSPDFTLHDIWIRHKEGIIVLLIFLVITTILIVRLFQHNKIIGQQQQHVREQNNQIKRIIMATQAGTWEWNIQTGATIFNERWAEMMGYTLAEISPVDIHTWEKFTHPDDLQAAKEHLQLYFNFNTKTDFYEADFRMKHKDGHWVWINARGQVSQWTEHGDPLYMSGTHTDISKRKEFEKKISRAHRLIEQSLNEIYIFDKSSLSFVYVNPGARENIGYSMEELSALTPVNVNPDISIHKFKKIIKPLLCHGRKKIKFNTVHQRKNGSCYPVEVHLQLLEDEQPVFIAIVIDITKQKEIKYQLIESRNDAINANKAKSIFLSRMSHELRTPLNAILGFAQLLELDEESFNSDQQDNIKEILDAGNHLLILIDEVLDLSKIDSGKFAVTMEQVKPGEILQQCLVLLSEQLKSKKIILQDNISDQGYVILADSVRFKQVLLNLLSNAIKYNKDHGSIIVDAECINEQRLRISVADTGEGIAAEKIAQLYQPFERFNKDNNTQGSGIGLTITKSLIELMGGTIDVKSTPDEGTVFWIDVALYE